MPVFLTVVALSGDATLKGFFNCEPGEVTHSFEVVYLFPLRGKVEDAQNHVIWFFGAKVVHPVYFLEGEVLGFEILMDRRNVDLFGEPATEVHRRVRACDNLFSQI